MSHYDKLRPSADLQFCDCKELRELLLVHRLTDNPVHCFACNGALDPQRLGLSSKQVDMVSSWHGQFQALYSLWLDCGEYEAWAKVQLLKRDGQVNRDGLAAVAALSALLPTYYWWFHDESDPEPLCCPVCGDKLSASRKHGHGQCDACQVVI
ncbi:DUF2310 family Zn-ribbon-containing protein [Dyella ginsengisoli]|uniref:DUF2310 family Zn-ribbon-containing protein n=1 Tax=Dyella ginsengisoli TaxID=363848 RepID=UPI00036F7629|nr:DUF2310 family Zn-ribbon-containing protein [Dyella ginsengisoli]